MQSYFAYYFTFIDVCGTIEHNLNPHCSLLSFVRSFGRCERTLSACPVYSTLPTVKSYVTCWTGLQFTNRPVVCRQFQTRQGLAFFMCSSNPQYA